ncbi:unnamed protein product [Notodromas monacha]|uniref:NADP-dependent oxidoreductase domain-containing protein n=1 Tax=Notodromas monacha TaxID=399045 RepID=A0A7R9BHN8_9CRUS|nr:unnamed protein product [Notodromas monacha]CAG0915658.1 unnamed protein product [Notodromas monacha]
MRSISGIVTSTLQRPTRMERASELHGVPEKSRKGRNLELEDIVFLTKWKFRSNSFATCIGITPLFQYKSPMTVWRRARTRLGGDGVANRRIEFKERSDGIYLGVSQTPRLHPFFDAMESQEIVVNFQLSEILLLEDVRVVIFALLCTMCVTLAAVGDSQFLIRVSLLLLRQSTVRIRRVFPKMPGAPIVTLSNGQKVPSVGLGTWKSKPGVVEQAVKDAIDVGYRHIDTAFVYENEKSVGEAIAAKIADGTVKREDLYVVTKLWNTFHNPADVEKAAQTSLESLGLDYVDLYHIHWPVCYKNVDGELFPKDESGKVIYSEDDYLDTYKAVESLVEKGLVKAIGLSNFNSKQIQRILDSCSIKPAMLQNVDGELFPKDESGKVIYSEDDYLDTYKAVESLVEKGLVKAIGLSNFNSKQIQRILDSCSIKPAMLQVESHPWLNQIKLQEFCTSKGLVLTAYSPLGSPDRPWATPEDPTLLSDPKITSIGPKYGKSTAQICIRYQVQKGRVVIPKSVSKSRLEENINVFDFELTDEDMAALDSFDKGVQGRVCHMNWATDHVYYPFGPDVEF